MPEMNNRIYADRRDAGRALVPEIKRLELTDPIVLGLPRGGIPVAYEVAM
jgi:predicted phosphoribosyltransferase